MVDTNKKCFYTGKQKTPGMQRHSLPPSSLKEGEPLQKTSPVIGGPGLVFLCPAGEIHGFSRKLLFIRNCHMIKKSK
jgi:hypothetical protein